VPDSLKYRLLVITSTRNHVLVDPIIEGLDVASPLVLLDSVIVGDSVEVLEGRRSRLLENLSDLLGSST